MEKRGEKIMWLYLLITSEQVREKVEEEEMGEIGDNGGGNGGGGGNGNDGG